MLKAIHKYLVLYLTNSYSIFPFSTSYIDTLYLTLNQVFLPTLLFCIKFDTVYRVST